MAGRGPGAKEATAVAKLKPNETWDPIALESEQWLLVKCFTLWRRWRGDRPGVLTVGMVLPGT